MKKVGVLALQGDFAAHGAALARGGAEPVYVRHAAQLAGIMLDGTEITEHRFAELADALELLSGPLRRRVSAVAGKQHCVYLEEGLPVAAVSG